VSARQAPGWRPDGQVDLKKQVLPRKGRYQWVYLWDWPLRITHWVTAITIVTLIVTGFYIGGPYFVTRGEASEHFLMGRVRLVHFSAAGVLVAAAIGRIYGLFAGNRFERWKALFPVHARDWQHMKEQLRAYFLIRPESAPQYLGHNPLQQVSYTLLYLIAIVAMTTGFALYGESSPSGFFHAVFTHPVSSLLGGIQRVRFVHHILTWVFMTFVPLHVYLAMRMDLLEQTGTVSSIVSGGRFVNRDVTYADGAED
jgi:Ni/Fe-hydrogenase b-type cytochrome subunit